MTANAITEHGFTLYRDEPGTVDVYLDTSKILTIHVDPDMDNDDAYTHARDELADMLRRALRAAPPDPVPAANHTDARPHSRACGLLDHPHGSQCHPNCPTCGGSPP